MQRHLQTLAILAAVLGALAAPAGAGLGDDLDDIFARGWTDTRAYQYPGVDVMLPDNQTVVQGAGSMRLRFEVIPTGLWDTVPSRSLGAPLNLAPAGDWALRFWVHSANLGSERVVQVLLTDTQGRVARLNVGVTGPGWQQVVLSLADAYGDNPANPPDLAHIEKVAFWCSTHPTRGGSLYLDGLEIVPADRLPRPIARVEAMPMLPQPYLLRDWKQVARDYDDLVFDFDRTGEYLPIPWWDTTWINFDRDTVGMPSYVGHFSMDSGNNHESINVMGAVVSGALVGIDKRNQDGHDFVLMMDNYFNVDSGEDLVLNRSYTDTGHTFWYEIFPNILYGQLIALYPGVGDMEAHFQTIADKWYDASVGMGGQVSPPSLPDFNYTAFDFDTMTPVYNGQWHEREAAAGVAWLEYMAYVKWGDVKYLRAAEWGLGYLEGVPPAANPLYELMLPYGAYVAARINAELGRTYDLAQLLDWCFTPGDWADGADRGGWGIVADVPWGGYDMDGIAGSSSDTGGYAFAMNTFHWAAAITPVARYDQRYARAIGKWMQNLASAARYFYANGFDAAHQDATSKAWADAYDPCYVVTYEGIRKFGRINQRCDGVYAIYTGQNLNGDYLATHFSDNEYQVFQESILAGGKDGLEVVWTLPLQAGTLHRLYVEAHVLDAGDADNGFEFSYATSPGGPYTSLFTVTKTSDDNEFHYFGLPAGLSGVIYIRAKDTNRVGGNYLADALFVDSLRVWSDITTTPFATGDALNGYHNSGTRTDFALYGASHVGQLAALVEPTNVERILQLDLRATDYFGDAAYPTYLYYNPYGATQSVAVDVGATPVDVYDTVRHGFVALGATGTVNVELLPDTAMVLVLAPAGGTIARLGNKLLIDGVVVDYRHDDDYGTCGEVLASPYRLAEDLDGDCRVAVSDLQAWSADWLAAVSMAPGDFDGNGYVDLDDFARLSAAWLTCNDPAGPYPCQPNW